MKIYISTDIEGVTGTTVWDETELNKPEYAAAQQQMTAEVAAACEGAIQKGASEVLVKDAHWTGRNIIASNLPRKARLVRGWSGHPLSMMQELDAGFRAALLIGYHSRICAGASPLEHTMTGEIAAFTINERPVSEFLLSAYTASYYKVPLVFVSGDQGLCDEVLGLNPNITTVAVKQGVGNSTINLHPELAVSLILEGVVKALSGDVSKCLVALPEHFSVELRFKEHHKAYHDSFYPGAVLKDPFTIQFETRDFFEVLRLLSFVA